MKNNFKGFLSIALSIIMVLTMMPVMTFAADETTNVAAIGETEYETLAKAIEAVEEGGTIVLLDNVIITEETRTWNSGSWYDGIYYIGDKSFTLDLGGYTVTHNGSVNDYLLNFKNDGSKANTITLKNGTVDAGTNAFCAICTSSTSTQQITINLEDINVINNISNGSTIKIRGGAVLNVNDGTVITGKNSYLGIECVASTVNIYDGAEIYMNGTTSYNGCLVGVCAGGTVNVYGGYGKGVKGGFIAMTSGGTINAYGGEWIANTDGSIGSDSNFYVLTAQNNKEEPGYTGPSVINVYGGTFRGGMDAWILQDVIVEKAELNIKGGNFNTDPERYLEGVGSISKNDDGSYSVKSAAVRIGEIEYLTLAEALEAANKAKGDYTITLLEDNAEVITFEQSKDANITIDGDGKTFKGKLTVKLSGDAFVIIDTIYNFNDVTYICEDGNTLDFVYVTSTCDTAGYSYYECKQCGKKLYEVKYQPLGHYYDEGSVVITEATCAKEGAKCVYCAKCGTEDLSKREIYEKKSHVYLLLSSAVLPSCTENGYMDLYYCVNCGQHIGGEVIPALDHVEGEDGKCMLCGAIQYKDEAYCTCGCHATGIKKLFFKIMLIFEKLAKKNTECECGAVHYTLKEEPTFFDRLLAAIKKVEEEDKNNPEEPDLI